MKVFLETREKVLSYCYFKLVYCALVQKLGFYFQLYLKNDSLLEKNVKHKNIFEAFSYVLYFYNFQLFCHLHGEKCIQSFRGCVNISWFKIREETDRSIVRCPKAFTAAGLGLL